MAAVKALQTWCRLRCEGYRDVSISNMTTSFRDGLALCALIHRHRPDLINFDSLKKENVYENNKLAFRVAEDELGIPALLDAEDMVALKVPDRLSILTYVSQYYNYFHGRSPIGGMGGMKRPADGVSDEPAGKKNQPVASKVFVSSKPARENSPPPSSIRTRTSPSPRLARAASKDAVEDKSHQTGTLSNKCVSCNKHVHLVQRHLVEGKLYHRSCAKSLTPTNPPAPLRILPTNTPVPRLTPPPDSTKTSTTTPAQTPSRLPPSWLTEKSSSPPSFSTTSSSLSPFRPASKETHISAVSKLTPSRTTCDSAASTPVNTTPTPAPRNSTMAAKTLQSKLRFFQSGNTASEEEKKTATTRVAINKGPDVTNKVQEATAGQAVTVVVNVGGFGRKEVKNESWNTGGGGKAAAAGADLKTKPAAAGADLKTKPAAAGADLKTKPALAGADLKTKAAAAAFISKTLSEENNNDSSKPSWMNVVLKKTDRPQVETPKEPEAIRGRKLLRVDPSLLANLQPGRQTDSRSPSPAVRTGLRARTPERGAPEPSRTSHNSSASESPADWRSKLRHVSRPADPSQSSPKPWRSNGSGPTSELPPRPPPPSSHPPPPNISVTPPAAKGFLTGQKDPTANGTKSESQISKNKPDYIKKEDIMKELQEIEENLNEWERRGVDLEVKLRSSEEDGEDDSLLNELMVEWFNLIRNKQVAMRRESELVYIGKTQELEEEQPSVEQELRRLMEKPERLKTSWDRKREEQLMAKLVEIVNARNAIVEGLDEDRLRFCCPSEGSR